MKLCPKCGEEKSVEQFSKRKSGQLQSWCKPCTNKSSCTWVKRNQAYVNKCAAKRSPSYQKTVSAWRDRNRDRLRKSQRDWKRKRYAENVNVRLLASLRARFIEVLHGERKSGTAMKFVGCSLESLKIYLESLWETGMSWDNYGRKIGQWSIDHIIPCSLFDMTQPDHQKVCFHFSNLQPMWHIENIRKGNKVSNAQPQ